MVNFLKNELAVFDSDLPVEKAWTPPSSWYTQPEFMALEKKAIFDNNWIPIAHTEQLAKNGSYLATCIAGEPVAIVRESESKIRALSNVCRHNAASILDGEGVTERLSCPYHGWQYDLSGALCKAPRMAGVHDFDRRQFQLPQLGLAEWGPLFLIRTKGNHTFEPLSGLTERLEQAGWRNLKHLKRRSYDIDCNWKVYIDNYLDGGYHVPILHPDLTQTVEIDTYTTELFDGWSLQSVTADASDRRMGHGALYAWVYPNLMLNLYGEIMDTNIVLPLSNDKCRVIFDWYFAEPHCHDLAFVEKSLSESHQVEMEDEGVCASVQRGLSSANYERGRYAPQVEHAKHHFHKRLHADLTASLSNS